MRLVLRHEGRAGSLREDDSWITNAILSASRYAFVIRKASQLYRAGRWRILVTNRGTVVTTSVEAGLKVYAKCPNSVWEDRDWKIRERQEIQKEYMYVCPHLFCLIDYDAKNS